MKKTYHGSCHCGALRYEADLDLSAGTQRCNCSFCAKTRMWKIYALAGELRITQDEDTLSGYQAAASQWPPGKVHHYFCRRCGVRPFSHGYLEQAPFHGWFHAVNVATLDDATDSELARTPIQYEDGRNDRWDAAPAETRHL